LVQGAVLGGSFGLLCLAVFSFIAPGLRLRRCPGGAAPSHSTCPSPGPSRIGRDGGQPGPIAL